MTYFDQNTQILFYNRVTQKINNPLSHFFTSKRSSKNFIVVWSRNLHTIF